MSVIDSLNINGTAYDISDKKKVSIEAQTLTNAQKAQARENIGAASAGDAGVTGVKGDAESTYRTGNVNITKANI